MMASPAANHPQIMMFFCSMVNFEQRRGHGHSLYDTLCEYWSMKPSWESSLVIHIFFCDLCGMCGFFTASMYRGGAA